jgi:cell division protein FtsN
MPMIGGTTRTYLALLTGLLTVWVGVSSQAQQAIAEPRCRPDEIDMGDYCASTQPPTTQEESDARRVTPFRSSSMMPGRTVTTDSGNTAQMPTGVPETPAQEPAERAAAPAVAGPGPRPAAADPVTPATSPVPAVEKAAGTGTHSGMGVQFGVYSSRTTARRVAQPLADAGLPVHLARLERAGRVLWACIHGPFPDTPSAQAAAGRLAIDHGIEDTYIKPLDNLELTELNHDAIEE